MAITILDKFCDDLSVGLLLQPTTMSSEEASDHTDVLSDATWDKECKSFVKVCNELREILDTAAEAEGFTSKLFTRLSSAMVRPLFH